MFGLQRLLIVGVVAAGVGTAYSVVDRNRDPIERRGKGDEPRRATAGVDHPPDPHRDAELARRARRPASDSERPHRATYDRVLEGWKDQQGNPPRARAAKAMPPTACRSVEKAPKDVDNRVGPYRLHRRTEMMFETASGFGFARMAFVHNSRGVPAPSRSIDRVELVSLLTDYEPSAYVLDEMATPSLVRQAERRPLDDFERRGLDAVRRGEELVWTREAPTRMFGAIRAKESCLECHPGAKAGDLLGAFTYYLNKPVDRLDAKHVLE
jgi:hypothetical protein